MGREIEVSFNNTMKKLNRDAKNLSFSMAKKYYQDFLCLMNLGDALGIPVTLSNLVGKSTMISTILNNALVLEEASYKAISCFKESNFYYYKRTPLVKISAKEEEDLLYEFLMYFYPALWDLYCELVDQGHVFYTSQKENSGESFIMPHVNDYYFSINKDYKSSLERLEIIIHELCHIESARVLLNYRSSCSDELLNQLLQETVSIYSEYSFFDYCIEHHIFKEEFLFHRNLEDFLLLKRLKSLYYFTISLRYSDVLIDINGHYLIHNGPILPEENIFFTFGKNLDHGEIQQFFYPIGELTALDLLEKEHLGYSIERMIKDFLIHIEEKGYLVKKLQFSRNFMIETLNSHLKPLQKKYPIPGYFV